MQDIAETSNTRSGSSMELISSSDESVSDGSKYAHCGIKIVTMGRFARKYLGTISWSSIPVLDFDPHQPSEASSPNGYIYIYMFKC